MNTEKIVLGDVLHERLPCFPILTSITKQYCLLNEISQIEEVYMRKKVSKPETDAFTEMRDDLGKLHQKLDAMLAVLLRHLNDEGLEKWNNQDKPNIAKMLIDIGFDNSEISRVTGLAYGSVANIRSKTKKGEFK